MTGIKTLNILLLFLFPLVCVIYFSADFSSLFILAEVRFPRFLLTLLVGAILAVVGSTYQMMLNNPLAEPYVLGLSSGAGFGLCLSLVIGLPLLSPVLGFLGAAVSMLVVWKLAHWNGYLDKTRLLLSGIAISLFFSAMISLLMYFNKDDLNTIIQILMGNLGRIFTNQEWYIFLGTFALCIVLLVYLYRFSRILNILTLGDLISHSSGIDVVSVQKKVFVITCILTAICVSFAGIIGFVGLIIPHIIRMIIGTNQKTAFIYSLICGSLFLLICDLISMHLTVIEIPVGIITSFLGCPFFIYIMLKNKG